MIRSAYGDRDAIAVRRAYVDTPEDQVHYIEEGRGEHMILLHQGPRSSRTCVKPVPLLAESYRSIAIDMLG